MKKITDIINQAETWLIGFCGLAALVLVSFDIFSRYFYPAWLQDWTGEVTVYLVVVAVILGSGSLTRNNKHIRADLFIRRLPQTLRWHLELATTLLLIAFCVVVLWLGYDAVAFSKLLDVRSESSIQFPIWIFYLVLPVGFALMVLHALLRLYELIFRFEPSLLDHVDEELEELNRLKDPSTNGGAQGCATPLVAKEH